MLKRYLSQLAATNFFQANVRLMAGVTLFIWCFMLMYGLLVYKPMYTAESVVMIKDSAIVSAYVEPEQMYSNKTTSSSAANPVLNTMGLLNSAAIMDALWDFFKKKHPEELKKRNIKTRKEWEKFYKDGSAFIKAKNKPGTDLITISFTWSDPKITQEAAKVVLAAFQEASLDLNQAEQRSRSKYLGKQVTELEQELAAVRSQKTAYKKKMKTVNVSSESVELTKMRTRFAEKLNQILARSEGKKAELIRYQAMLGMTPEQALEASAIGMNTTLGNLKNEYYTLSQTHAFLSTTLTEKNPKVQEVRNKMKQVENNIRKELTNTLGYESDPQTTLSVSDATRGTVINEMVRTQAEVIFLDQEADALRTKLKEVDSQIAGFPAVEEGISNIEQRERSLSDSLDALRKKYLEAQLREAQTLSNVFIVDEPRLPKQADFPNPLHLIVISILLGLGAGAGVLILRYKLRLDERLPQVIQNIADRLEKREQDLAVAEEIESATTSDINAVDPLDTLFGEKSGLVLEAELEIDPETQQSTLQAIKKNSTRKKSGKQQQTKVLTAQGKNVHRQVRRQNVLAAKGDPIPETDCAFPELEEQEQPHRKIDRLHQELACKHAELVRYAKALATRAELLKRQEALIKKRRAEIQTQKSLNTTLAKKLKEYTRSNNNSMEPSASAMESESRGRILTRYLGDRKEQETTTDQAVNRKRPASIAVSP